MRRRKILRVMYEYDDYREDSVVRSVSDDLPWTEVSEEDFLTISEAVKNRHKLSRPFRDHTLWLVEDTLLGKSEEPVPFTLEGLIEDYKTVTQKELAAVEKRKKQAAERALRAEEGARDKKLKLLQKLKVELGES